MGRGDSGGISKEDDRVWASANADGVLDARSDLGRMGDGRGRKGIERDAFDMARNYAASNRRPGGRPKSTAVFARCLCSLRQPSSGTLLVARQNRYRRI